MSIDENVNMNIFFDSIDRYFIAIINSVRKKAIKLTRLSYLRIKQLNNFKYDKRITHENIIFHNRKMHKRSKVKEMELEMNGHTNRALNIGDSEDVATFRNPDYNSNLGYKERNGHCKL